MVLDKKEVKSGWIKIAKNFENDKFITKRCKCFFIHSEQLAESSTACSMYSARHMLFALIFNIFAKINQTKNVKNVQSTQCDRNFRKNKMQKQKSHMCFHDELLDNL